MIPLSLKNIALSFSNYGQRCSSHQYNLIAVEMEKTQVYTQMSTVIKMYHIQTIGVKSCKCFAEIFVCKDRGNMSKYFPPVFLIRVDDDIIVMHL